GRAKARRSKTATRPAAVATSLSVLDKSQAYSLAPRIFGCISYRLSRDPLHPAELPHVCSLLWNPIYFLGNSPRTPSLPGGAAEIFAVEEHAEQRRIRRQHHSRALAREGPRRLHGTQECVEFWRTA